MTNLLIIDLEATCSNDQSIGREDMEIIEIGFVIIDRSYNEIIRYSKIIKPVKKPTLTKFCTELTGITQIEVNNGISFKTAINEIDQIIKDHNVSTYGSWGAYDKNQLIKDCTLHNTINPFGLLHHWNVKESFANHMNIRPCGLGKAVKTLKLEFQGNQHCGLDDAINITRIIRTVKLLP